jgi:hypothetical protein
LTPASLRAGWRSAGSDAAWVPPLPEVSSLSAPGCDASFDRESGVDAPQHALQGLAAGEAQVVRIPANVNTEIAAS